MEQSPNFSKGDKIKVFNINTDECYGTFIFEKINGGILYAEGNGQIQQGDMRMLRLETAECTHEWKRVTMFRHDEFCCRLCPAVRPFNKETDEAA